LDSQGIRVTAAPLLGDHYQEDLYQGRSRRWESVGLNYLERFFHLLRAPRFDLIWIEYEIFPWLPAFGEWLLSAMRIPYVVDYDDAIFHRYETQASRLGRIILKDKINSIMRQANLVIVGNRFLRDRAISVGARHVELLPTVVDLTRYTARLPDQDHPFTIGWIGSPSTVKYLSLVESVLAEFCAGERARIVVVGARDARLARVKAEIRPWSESTEVADIQSFDIGIMPLPDEPWERGKSGYKLIQYMASMRPVIASPVGVNCEIVEHGVNGFLASSQSEWRDALEALLASRDLRNRLGKAGRKKVESAYCLAITAPRLAAALRNALSEDG
jgi:glycosyltransferase involved in cell wall biosynthesis